MYTPPRDAGVARPAPSGDTALPAPPPGNIGAFTAGGGSGGKDGNDGRPSGEPGIGEPSVDGVGELATGAALSGGGVSCDLPNAGRLSGGTLADGSPSGDVPRPPGLLVAPAFGREPNGDTGGAFSRDGGGGEYGIATGGSEETGGSVPNSSSMLAAFGMGKGGGGGGNGADAETLGGNTRAAGGGLATSGDGTSSFGFGGTAGAGPRNIRVNSPSPSTGAACGAGGSAANTGAATGATGGTGGGLAVTGVTGFVAAPNICVKSPADVAGGGGASTVAG